MLDLIDRKKNHDNSRVSFENCFSIYEQYSHFVCNDKRTSDALQGRNRTLEKLIENETCLKVIFKK